MWRICEAVMLATLVLTATARAKTGTSANPFEGVKVVAVVPSIGGGLTADSSPSISQELFDGDSARIRAFTKQVVARAEPRLLPFKVQENWDPPADGFLILSFFGRPVKIEGATPLYVYEVLIKAGRIAGDEAGPDGKGATETLWSRTAIGIATKDGLESQLMHDFESLLEELRGLAGLPSCR